MSKKIIVLTILLITLFTACSKQNNKDSSTKSDAFVDGYNTITTVKETTTKNIDIKHKDIEKVVVSYLDVKEEITEEQQSFDFIDNIKNCNTVPDTSMTAKIGDIKIKYVDKKEETNFATLYLGLDGSVYAKYIKNQDTDYAYKVN